MSVVSDCLQMIKDHSSYTTAECLVLPREIDCDMDADCNTLLRGLYLTASSLINYNEHHAITSRLSVTFQPGGNALPVIIFSLLTEAPGSDGANLPVHVVHEAHSRFVSKSEWRLASRLLRRCCAVPVLLHRDTHRTICMIAFHRAEQHPTSSSRRHSLVQSRRLLLLEDDCFVGPMLVEQLSDAGYEVTLCGTVQEARTALHRLPYGLALFDQHLPDGTGIEFLQELRNQHNDLPIVLLSGDIFSTELRRWLYAVNADAISKPFVIGTLLETITQLRSSSQAGIAA